MRTRSVLSLVAAVSASIVVGAIVVYSTAAPAHTDPAASAGGRTSVNSSSSGGAGRGQSGSAASSSPYAGKQAVPSAAAAPTYQPPRPGRYTYSGPGGATVTQLAVTQVGQGAWRLDESVLARSALVQRRQESWTRSGVRVLAVWEAGQPQPCIWSNPPLDVAFAGAHSSSWSIDASCRVSNGSAGESVTRVQGSFRTTGSTQLTIAGRAVSAWLITGAEVTTVDGTVHGHRYHTVDRTTTRVWFLPSIGMPGRTELSGTVSITSDKGTTTHRIGQVTQLESLTPQ